MGAYEAITLVIEEAILKYHSFMFLELIKKLKQCMVGSLTGAVASERVTEACEGRLKLDGNQL